jgi:hypothetical protein
MENIKLELDEKSTDEMFFINIPEKIQKDEEQDVSIPKIIFIVPYRDREQQLIFFNRHMEYILEDYQENDKKIMIIHQNDERSFNCGAIKNIGFLIVKQQYPNNYKDITLIFNDVDTLPFTKNFINYKTTNNVIKHFYGFKHTLGGIVSITGGDFERINGFPNFWAWGYEDNMFYERAIRSKIAVDRQEFYPFADKNILHFYDGYVKQVNKKEFDRYTNATKEGIYSIYNLEYTYEEGTNTYHINNFDTQYKEDVTAIKEHDLHKGTKPFHHNKGRGAAMSMLL